MTNNEWQKFHRANEQRRIKFGLPKPTGESLIAGARKLQNDPMLAEFRAKCMHVNPRKLPKQKHPTWGEIAQSFVTSIKSLAHSIFRTSERGTPEKQALISECPNSVGFSKSGRTTHQDCNQTNTATKQQQNISQKASTSESHQALDGLKIMLLEKCFGNSEFASDFRYVNWGATRSQVKLSEHQTGPIWHEDESVIAYETTFDAKPAIVSFRFEDGCLTEAVYGIEGGSHNYDTYCKIQTQLTALLGAPAANDEVWTGESKDSSVDKNLAIQKGSLNLFTMWLTPRSKINIRCWKSEDSIVRHAIHLKSAVISNN